MFLSAVFSSELFEKTALLLPPPPKKNLPDKRALLTGVAEALPPRQNKQRHIRTAHPREARQPLVLYPPFPCKPPASLQALFCLSSTSTAHSDWGTKAGGQAPLWRELREKELKLDKMVKKKRSLSWNIWWRVHFPPSAFVCMYLCLCVFEGERENTAGTEKWVEVCGKPWCSPVFVCLGLCSRGASLGAPDNVGLTLANILSSCSGDRLNWERLAGVVFAASTLCGRQFGVCI